MVMEGRRKLGAKADAALGGDTLSDRGLWSCSVDSGDVPKSMVKEYLEKIDMSFVARPGEGTCRRRQGKAEGGAHHILEITASSRYQLGAVSFWVWHG